LRPYLKRHDIIKNALAIELNRSKETGATEMAAPAYFRKTLVA
jgi:hypothetical protein